jgi:hypothetical protein
MLKKPLSNFFIIKSILIFLLFFTVKIVAQENQNSVPPASPENMRLSKFFLIGEKAVSKTDVQDISKIDNFGKLNAFSIFDVKLRNDEAIIEFLRQMDYCILIVADLRKKGEKTWNRISVINRFTREVKKTPESIDQNDSGEDSTNSSLPFYVDDRILSNNPFLKKGDYVQVIFNWDLADIEKKSRSIITIASQEIYLMAIGSSPQKYSATDGDELRLRFLRGDYPKNRKKRNYADLIAVEDEMNFYFKEYGIKLYISPTIVFGSPTKDNFDIGNFDPIAKNPSLGSNIYFTYEGKDSIKKLLNWIPGIHLSLLGLVNSEDSNEAEFTIGFVHPILPSLRDYFGIFYGWHKLKNPVIGITFSPSINFRSLVSAEKAKKDG